MPQLRPINPNSFALKGQRPVAKYLKEKEFRDNRLWTMVKGRLITFENGEWLSEVEFNEKYPVPENAKKIIKE